MFERDDRGGMTALHHPFTPSCSVDSLQADPEAALSQAYDMVLNGSEIGGGSVRIHDQAMQQAVFDLLGIDKTEAESKFGFLLGAASWCAAACWIGLWLGSLGDADGRWAIDS